MAKLPDAWFDPPVTMPEISSSNVSDVTVATSFPLRTNREPLAVPAGRSAVVPDDVVSSQLAK
jgi:hypothetical protein